MTHPNNNDMTAPDYADALAGELEGEASPCDCVACDQPMRRMASLHDGRCVDVCRNGLCRAFGYEIALAAAAETDEADDDATDDAADPYEHVARGQGPYFPMGIDYRTGKDFQTVYL